MGNSQNKILFDQCTEENRLIAFDQRLKAERLINLKPNVTIGITGYVNKINPLSFQKIRFCENGKLK